MLPMRVSGLFPGRSTGRTASPPPQLDVAIDVLPVVYDPRNIRSVTATLRLRAEGARSSHSAVAPCHRNDLRKPTGVTRDDSLEDDSSLLESNREVRNAD